MEPMANAGPLVRKSDDRLIQYTGEMRAQVRGFVRDFFPAVYTPAQLAHLAELDEQNINNLSNEDKKKRKKSHNEHAQLFEELKKVSTTSYRSFLRTKLYTPLFLEALIWRYVCEEVLDQAWCIWPIESPRDGTIGRMLRGGSRAVQDWRATQTEESLNRLRATWGQGLEDMPTVSTRCTVPMEKLLKPLTFSNGDDDGGFREAINDILDTATKIGKKMMVASAKIEFHYQSDQPFDGKSMEICEKGESHTNYIYLLVRPALVRRGDHRGTMLNYRYCLLKAEVCHGRGPAAYNDAEMEEVGADPGPSKHTLATSSKGRPIKKRKTGDQAAEAEGEDDIPMDIDDPDPDHDVSGDYHAEDEDGEVDDDA
ncbi:hypothetical protein F4780DRAFT_786319 [Xylariomycetidae sp. FL0641]|nr:hypothetical protein F4780DRAFT_786319 [Xylariomycetidae sp. FL0641]